MEAELAYESFEQDMQRGDSASTTSDLCGCCLCMWKYIFCFKTRENREARSRRTTPAVNQYRAPEINPCTHIETALDTEDDIRAQERGQLLPKDGHVSAPPSSNAHADVDAKGETSGMKPLRHHRGKGSKGSGSSFMDLFTSGGLVGKPGSSALMEDDDICPTCLDPYTEDNPKIWTRCGHHFHMPCIFEWMERRDTCPMCESKMVLADDDLDLAA